MIDINVPISEKYMLTMKEASVYFGIGENKQKCEMAIYEWKPYTNKAETIRKNIG